MTMQAFQIGIALSTPVIMNGMTLDGLLGGILYEGREVDDWASELNSLPLKSSPVPGSEKPLYHASCAQVAYGVRYTDVKIIRALSLRTMVAEDINTGNRKMKKVYNDSGAYANLVTEMTAANTPFVAFFGVGDVDAVLDILRRAPAIGARRRSGYGVIARTESGRPDISARIVEGADMETFGLLDVDGNAARPIPIPNWQTISNSQPVKKIATWYNPYHDRSASTLCATPPFGWDVMAREAHNSEDLT